MEDLRSWLNGNRDFDTGVPLYFKYGLDKQFAQLLLQGATAYTTAHLFDKLKDAYFALKNKTIQPEPAVIVQEKASYAPTFPQVQTAEIQNKLLYNSVKAEADKLYKEMMNLRVQLFALCPIDETRLENDDFTYVKEREGLVLQVMDLQYEVDMAYDKLRYVAEHGTLPDQPEIVDDIPDNGVLLANMRNNLKKAINKQKGKEQTPERIASIQAKQEKLKLVNDKISQHISAQ